MSTNTYVIKPKTGQYIADNWELLTFCIAAYLFSGVEIDYISYFCLGTAFFLTFILLYRFWFFTTVEWTVNGEKIRYTRGIFNRSTDFLELYRVIDYREQQGLIQQILDIKTLIIYSGDKSHGILCIYGLAEDNNIVEFIRNSVEYQKKQKKIYEITNN